jgi:hypothetical protein
MESALLMAGRVEIGTIEDYTPIRCSLHTSALTVAVKKEPNFCSSSSTDMPENAIPTDENSVVPAASVSTLVRRPIQTTTSRPSSTHTRNPSDIIKIRIAPPKSNQWDTFFQLTDDLLPPFSAIVTQINAKEAFFGLDGQCIKAAESQLTRQFQLVRLRMEKMDVEENHCFIFVELYRAAGGERGNFDLSSPYYRQLLLIHKIFLTWANLDASHLPDFDLFVGHYLGGQYGNPNEVSPGYLVNRLSERIPTKIPSTLPEYLSPKLRDKPAARSLSRFISRSRSRSPSPKKERSSSHSYRERNKGQQDTLARITELDDFNRPRQQYPPAHTNTSSLSIRTGSQREGANNGYPSQIAAGRVMGDGSSTTNQLQAISPNTLVHFQARVPNITVAIPNSNRWDTFFAYTDQGLPPFVSNSLSKIVSELSLLTIHFSQPLSDKPTDAMHYTGHQINISKISIIMQMVCTIFLTLETPSYACLQSAIPLFDSASTPPNT